jgi:hypothetical protein
MLIIGIVTYIGRLNKIVQTSDSHKKIHSALPLSSGTRHLKSCSEQRDPRSEQSMDV